MKKIIIFSLICIFIANIFACEKEVQFEDFIVAIENNNKDKFNELLIDNTFLTEPEMSDLLQLAVQHNNTDIILILLKYGCNPNTFINNEDEDSLLSWAIRNSNMLLIKVLLEKGASCNYINNDGFSVFLLAIDYLPEDSLFQFLHHNIDFSYEKTNQGTTYFTRLMNKQYYSILEYILNDVELSKKLFYDEALSIKLIYTWKEGAESIANLLLEKGMVLDNEKYPLIQEAAIEMKYEAVKWLLDNGISARTIYDEPLQTYYNGTALEVAQFALSRINRFSDEAEYEEAREKMNPIIKLLEERIILEGEVSTK